MPLWPRCGVESSSRTLNTATSAIESEARESGYERSADGGRGRQVQLTGVVAPDQVVVLVVVIPTAHDGNNSERRDKVRDRQEGQHERSLPCDDGCSD